MFEKFIGTKKCKLDFIHLGMPRCGSTWLFECLNEHKEIFSPKEKDYSFGMKKVQHIKETKTILQKECVGTVAISNLRPRGQKRVKWVPGTFLMRQRSVA